MTFLQTLRLKRRERDRVARDYRVNLVCHINGVYLSEIAGIWLVWVLTPRCRYVRTISSWGDQESSFGSMSRLLLVRNRRQTVRA